MDNTSFAPGNNSINNSVPSSPAPQYSEPEHKHFLNKKFIVTFIILLLLGAGAYAGIWYWGNQQAVQVPDVVIDVTANWKIYQNDTYGFDIKYPSNWISKGSWSENGGFFYVAFGTANTIDSKPLVTLRIYPNQTTLDKFIKYFDYLNGRWFDFRLGGVTGKIIESVGENSKPITAIASVHNSYGYELAATVFGNNTETVRSMGSTFKFTESNSGGQTMCTQEAKQCPDGSYVSRTGPNCEFATCP